jgi:CHASE2 domain-containing sensor protein
MRLWQLFIHFFLLVKAPSLAAWRFVVERFAVNRRHFLRSVLISLIISIFMFILAHLGHFRPWEHQITTFLQAITQKKAKNVALLFITDKEYQRSFRGKSPLSRERLAAMVDVLVKLNARVIALDIDLSDPTPDDPKLLRALDGASAAGIPVVAVGNLNPLKSTANSISETSHDLAPYASDELVYTREGFLLFGEGGPGEQWSDKVMWGGVFFMLDSDAVFRQAQALYMIKTPAAGHDPLPSFPVAVAAAFQGISQKDLQQILSRNPLSSLLLASRRGSNEKEIRFSLEPGGQIIPNFIGNYEMFEREVDLTSLLEEYSSAKPAKRTIFSDKIVLVGGVYDRRDFYRTPLGKMSGAEILANIIQNLLSGNLISHMNYRKAFIIELVLGILVGMIFILSSHRRAMIICFIGLFPALYLSSYWAFSSIHYWFNFWPTIAGVMLHGQIKRTEDSSKKIETSASNSELQEDWSSNCHG